MTESSGDSVDDEVIEQLAIVRETGAVNMMNKGGVKQVAAECDLQELVEFIENASASSYMDHLKEMGERR